MEITTLEEYIEFVWNAPSVDALSDKAWYDIALYAQEGFKWDMELMALTQRPLPIIPKDMHLLNASTPPDIKTQKQDSAVNKKAEDLFF